MNNTTEVLELFPTPLYTTHIPNEFASIIPWLDGQKMRSIEVDSANYGERSDNSYILDEPECKKLHDYILEHITSFANDILLYDYESYKFSQSWISLKHPGQHHTQHTHPNSLISGVFFYGEPSENTPAIKFHKTNGGMTTPHIMAATQHDKRNSKFAWEHFDVTFTPGLLLLFPSWLFHSVPLNETDKTRCSLAFNVVPSAGLGHEASLTELKF